MFDIGFTELLLLSAVGLLVLGPERLPGAVRSAGRWLGRLRRSFNKIRADLEGEFDTQEFQADLHNEAVLQNLAQTQQELRAGPENVIAPDPATIATDPDTITANPAAISPDSDAISHESDAIAANPDAISPDSDAIAANPAAISPDSDAIAANPAAIAPDPDTIAASPAGPGSAAADAAKTTAQA